MAKKREKNVSFKQFRRFLTLPMFLVKRKINNNNIKNLTCTLPRLIDYLKRDLTNVLQSIRT